MSNTTDHKVLALRGQPTLKETLGNLLERRRQANYDFIRRWLELRAECGYRYAVLEDCDTPVLSRSEIKEVAQRLREQDKLVVERGFFSARTYVYLEE